MNERKDNTANLYQLEKAVQFIMEGDHFLVVSHVQPDGDAASSTMAVGLILKALNKSYTMLNADPIPQKFQYLSGFESVGLASGQAPDAAKFIRVIAVDCADYSRIGQADACFDPDALILNIDHHPTNDGYGAVQLIQSEAAATVEILFDLANKLGIEWKKELSDCIYTGLLTDTGGFRYSNTTPKVMRIASQMLSYGTEGHRLAEHLLERIAMSHISLLKRALSTLSFEAGNRISWVQITQQDLIETQANNEDLEGLVNYPRNIEGVEVGVLFKEISNDTVKASFRSNGNIDVAAFAKSHGGGGHVRAAGCTLHMPLSSAVSHVIDGLKRQFV